MFLFLLKKKFKKAGPNEEVMELVPTKRCCEKCQAALTEEGLIDKVTKELWNSKAIKEQEGTKKQEIETGKCPK